MDKQFTNPTDLMIPRGFTHIVSARGGRTIYVSGQTAVDIKGEIVGKGDIRLQTEKTYENLQVALAAAGATFADVVKVNIFVLNLRAQDLQVIREVRTKYYSRDHPPASTLVGVPALAVDGLLIEIEAIAVVE
jgi:enamine deaminase RidA (YjgF/YER057c/UK114 family)